VKLVGTRSNRDAIGARVTITSANGTRLSAMVKSGSSYLSQSEFPLTFGLGKPANETFVNLEIVWPNGGEESIPHVAANQFITIKEGAGILIAKPISFTPPVSATPVNK
jgi:hypothetical protein